MPAPETTVWFVLLASGLTAAFTGLGVVPFFFVKKVDKRFLGIGNSVAAGLMLGASLGLSWEAASASVTKLAVGLAVGVLLVLLTNVFLPQETPHQQAGNLSATDLRKILTILVVMTAHSFAEGIGVGVSFGGRAGLGNLISTAIAIHNIPEGIAISLVLIPRGFSKLQASMWSIFSSLPQPLMAVPAFLFVLVFKPFLPIGLGLAAGAMFYMVFFELMPEAFEHTSRLMSVSIALLATLGMLVFQMLL